MGNICSAFSQVQVTAPKEVQEEVIIQDDTQPHNENQTKKGHTPNDFQQIKKLGEGSYGKVFLVKRKSDDEYFALKRIKKENFISNQARLRDILNEKKILLTSKHPFIVQLYFTFQDAKYFYYGMELVKGGVLLDYIQKKRKLSEQLSKFYAAQVVLALKYLHYEIQTIYRDLKPENILVDQDGFIRLTDFGLSTIGLDKAKSVCGTLVYIAPEVLYGNYYQKEVDYWGLGCLIFEMIYGETAFKPETGKISDLKNLILGGKFRFPLNTKFSDEGKDIVSKLICVNPEKRLGSKGIEEIMNHPWFKEINWEDLYQKKIKGDLMVQVLKTENMNTTVQESLQQPTNIKIQGFTWTAEENMMRVGDYKDL